MRVIDKRHKVESSFEKLETALEDYRQSLKDKEDEPGETARQFAKDATQNARLKLSIKRTWTLKPNQAGKRVTF